jgi:hypothetical protein
MAKQTFPDSFNSFHGSLRFISKKHGLFKFGYEERNGHLLKISSTIQFEGGLENLFRLVQNDLQRLEFWVGAKFKTMSIHPRTLAENWRIDHSSASTLEAQTYESQKQSCRLSLCLLEDHFTRLIVLEFTLEPLMPGSTGAVD